MEITELRSGRSDGVLSRTGTQKIGVPGVTDWVQFSLGEVSAGLAGTATAVTAVVERSFVDPSTSAHELAHPAGAVVSGNPAAGITPSVYTETAVGWWRWNITAIAGGYVYASLAGSMT